MAIGYGALADAVVRVIGEGEAEEYEGAVAVAAEGFGEFCIIHAIHRGKMLVHAPRHQLQPRRSPLYAPGKLHVASAVIKEGELTHPACSRRVRHLCHTRHAPVVGIDGYTLLRYTGGHYRLHGGIVQHLYNLAHPTTAMGNRLLSGGVCLGIAAPQRSRVLLIALNVIPPICGGIHRHQICPIYRFHCFLQSSIVNGHSSIPFAGFSRGLAGGNSVFYGKVCCFGSAGIFKGLLARCAFEGH